MDKRQIEIVDQLYKTIVTPEKWSNTLDLMTEDIGAYGINIFVGDRVLKELQNGWSSASLNPITKDYHEQGFFQDEANLIETFNTITAAGMLSGEEIEKQHNLLSNNPVDFNRIHNWFREKYGVHNRFLGMLNHHPSQFDSLSVLFADLPPDEINSKMLRLQGYQTHIANLVNVSRPFLLLKARFNAVLEVLDRFKLGVFFLNFNGDLIDKNSMAQQLLDQQDGLRLSLKNTLFIQDPAGNSQFQRGLNNLQQEEPQQATSRLRFIIKRPSGKS